MDSSNRETQCYVNNYFHESKDGCMIVTGTNNRTIHVFNKTRISISDDGYPLYMHVKSLATGVEIRFTSMNSVGGQVSSLLPTSFIKLEDYLTNLERAVDLILELKRTSDDITVCIKKKTKHNNIAIAVKSLYDCFIKIGTATTNELLSPDDQGAQTGFGNTDMQNTNTQSMDCTGFVPNPITDTPTWGSRGDEMMHYVNELQFFRPVSFNILNLEYYKAYQKSIMEVFTMTTTNLNKIRKKQEDENGMPPPFALQNQNTFGKNTKRGKNQKTCNSAYFVKHPSDLIECRLGTKDNCPHIAEYENDKQNNKSKSTEQIKVPPCKKLWKKLLHENTLDKVITFECLHPENGGEYLQDYFGRCHRLHTLFCFPSALLSDKWLSLTMAFLKNRARNNMPDE